MNRIRAIPAPHLPPPENCLQMPARARLPTGYLHALPPPPGGRGRSAKRGRGGDCGYRFARDRGGGGPLPVGPSPDVIATTVQCPGTHRGKLSLEPLPGTASRWTAHLAVLELRLPLRGTHRKSHLNGAPALFPRNIAYRNALPRPRGRGIDAPAGASSEHCRCE
jgi:hypothetical protein